jgi:hypothetical protein
MRIQLLFLFLASLMLFTPNLTAQNFDHAVFDGLLQRYVVNGRVDYQSLKADRASLTAYLKQLERVNTEDFQRWSKAEQMAFWINAYNAITIEGILRNYPIQWGGLLARARFPQSSIRQISGFWDTMFVRVMGRELTLNDIEHKILRQEFGEPRIHFVIVCASVGCPILENRAFFAADLASRLDQATRNFIRDPEKVRLDRPQNVLYLSPIFDWYAADFPASAGSRKNLSEYSQAETGIIEFVLKYFPETEQKSFLQNQPKIKYLDYDWSLNEQKQ